MVLKRVYRKSTGRFEYALVSKSNPKKILFYFGPSKPSKSEFLRQERRVQYWKSRKSFGSFPKKRVWVKRRDRINQRYWVGKKMRRNYGSQIIRKDLPFLSNEDNIKQFLSDKNGL